MSQTILNPVYRKRLWKHRVGIALSVMAMSVGLIFLMWILWTLLSKGFAGLSLGLFTQDTPGPGSDGGGLRNAIVGSLMIVGLATFISTPIGILAGVYLAEYGEDQPLRPDHPLCHRHHALGPVDRASACSSGPCLRGHVAKHYSGYAGSIALSLIAVPVVVRTTDNMLRLVPQQPARSRVCAGRATLEGGDPRCACAPSRQAW